nr:hypothetical protein [Lactococcus cremoris]WKC57274.1 hypothetical protein LLUC073_13920 [Lactococcus cremoris]
MINETDEGKVFWQNINQLTDLKLASGFAEMAEMMLRSSYSEFIYEIDGDTWKKKFYCFLHNINYVKMQMEACYD